MISRREFIRTTMAGVLYIALDTAEADFLVGDSMAFLWNRPGATTIAGPTWTIKKIEKSCARFVKGTTQKFRNAIIFAGTADCLYPPAETYKSVKKAAYSFDEIRGIVNSQEKCDQVCSDMEILVNTPAAANNIREDRSYQLRSVMQTGKRLGMVLMDESLVALAQQEKISKIEALMRAEDASFVQAALAPKKKGWLRSS